MRIFILLILLGMAGCSRNSDVASVAAPAATPAAVPSSPAIPELPLGSATPAEPVASRVRQGPVIQIALVLDTSKSMDGLLHQARTRLWNVVTEMGSARHKGQRPNLEVALYEYGCNHPAARGHVRQVVPFTTDLDAVSEELFKLTSEGGLENPPWAVEAAAEGLDWSQDPDDLKAIFIAGNEVFEQGPVSTRSGLGKAASRGIVVNTIFCGKDGEGRQLGWDEVARAAGGAFVAIDQDRTVAVSAPQDAALARLNEELNKTYVPFGEAGEEGRSRQLSQDDASAAQAPEALAARAGAKAQSYYDNSSWDLVDATQKGKVKAENLPAAAYPTALRDKSPQQRAAYVQQQAQHRAEVQKEIQRLVDERKDYLEKKDAGQGESLDTALVTSLKKQGSEKGYKF
ncbi:MAG: VWA domain-containing protein [Armatimonadetes bacterium]|nr:VWA domain-containing protein [Armatimonadota bacterium]